MFVYYYVHLNRPFEEVEHRLLGITNGFEGLAGAAYRDGEEIHARLATSVEHARIAKTIRLKVGAPRRGDDETTMPLTWEATGTPGLFPRMEADLVIANIGPHLTQVTLRGSYDPPLGALGRALDRTLFHRVAEASVKGFLDRIAAAIAPDGDEPRVTKTGRPGPNDPIAQGHPALGS